MCDTHCIFLFIARSKFESLMSLFTSDSEQMYQNLPGYDSDSPIEGDLSSIQEEDEDESPIQMTMPSSPGTVSKIITLLSLKKETHNYVMC